MSQGVFQTLVLSYPYTVSNCLVRQKLTAIGLTAKKPFRLCAGVFQTPPLLRGSGFSTRSKNNRRVSIEARLPILSEMQSRTP